MWFPEALYNFCVPTGISSKWEKTAQLYCLDLAWPDIKLDVEVDGPYHKRGKQPEKDSKRDAWLTDNGWTVLRFSEDQDILGAMNVVKAIQCTISRLRGTPVTPSKDA